MACQSACDCTDILQDPVCGDDGSVYPSACLAGCHYIDNTDTPLSYVSILIYPSVIYVIYYIYRNYIET